MPREEARPPPASSPGPRTRPPVFGVWGFRVCGSGFWVLGFGGRYLLLGLSQAVYLGAGDDAEGPVEEHREALRLQPAVAVQHLHPTVTSLLQARDVFTAHT